MHGILPSKNGGTSGFEAGNGYRGQNFGNHPVFSTTILVVGNSAAWQVDADGTDAGFLFFWTWIIVVLNGAFRSPPDFMDPG